MARKTINVSQTLSYANKQLARKDEAATKEFKMGVCIMIEEVLRLTGNYNGYNYNLWDEGGYEAWKKAGEPEGKEKEKYMYSEFGGQYDRHYYYPTF